MSSHSLHISIKISKFMFCYKYADFNFVIRCHPISTYASKGDGGVINSYAYACKGGGEGLRIDFFAYVLTERCLTGCVIST